MRIVFDMGVFYLLFVEGKVHTFEVARRSSKIGIIGSKLVPFNEAYANQMRVLSEKLDAKIITCDDVGWVPFKKMGRYFVVNTKFLMQRAPVLSFVNGLFFYLIVKLYERRFSTIILSAGVESEFLKYLNLKKCIPIISTIDDEAKAKKFASEIAPKLKKIIVQNRRVKDKLISCGVDSDKIHFMYPIVDLNEFRYTKPPSLNEFKILFASAPNVENPHENNFEVKGVPLLLEAFKEFIKEEDAILYIVWRGKYNSELYQMIKRLDLKEHVEVIDGVVDMPEMYAKTHITVIPFLNLWRSPEIPLSAVESLACGRPVVTTDVGKIAEIVKTYRCGCVAKPSKDDFLLALKECKKKYKIYQRNCVGVADDLFSFDADKLRWDR